VISIKQQTRERMAWSGERYAVARRKVVALSRELREAVEAAERGETVEREDYAEYADQEAD